MRTAMAAIAGCFAVLTVALWAHLVSWIGFTWLDEVLFIGYVLSGEPWLAAATGFCFLLLVGAAVGALGWQWAEGARGGTAFWRGFFSAMVAYLVGVAISNPFMHTFHGQFDGRIPAPVAALMSTSGWVGLLESLAGHIILGLVLGICFWLASEPEQVPVESGEGL